MRAVGGPLARATARADWSSAVSKIGVRHAASIRAMLLLAGLAVSGCDLMPDPEFAALQDALTLRIVEAKRNASGPSLDFSFELANRGSRDARACLGPSRSVDYHWEFPGGSGGGVMSHSVDHAGCMREFTIQPGSVMSWAETIEMRELRQGTFEVKVEVQITNPNRCGNWGNCTSFDVESNRVDIP